MTSLRFGGLSRVDPRQIGQNFVLKRVHQQSYLKMMQLHLNLINGGRQQLSNEKYPAICHWTIEKMETASAHGSINHIP